eukprot:scaffold138522_cov30-Tisochrysis_lutea.AAC.3
MTRERREGMHALQKDEGRVLRVGVGETVWTLERGLEGGRARGRGHASKGRRKVETVYVRWEEERRRERRREKGFSSLRSLEQWRGSTREGEREGEQENETPTSRAKAHDRRPRRATEGRGER